MQTITIQPEVTPIYRTIFCAGAPSPGKDMPTQPAPDPPTSTKPAPKPKKKK